MFDARGAGVRLRDGEGIMLRIELAAALLFVAPAAHAHDRWADGEPVPAWVRAVCCGPTDVHHLRADQVELRSDGWHIEGYPDVVPESKAEPSPDGDYWVFYKQFPVSSGGGFSNIYCFFVPPFGS